MPRELIVMVGESGSGKSTLARQMVAQSKGGMVRVNRDELRLMLHDNQCKKRDMEDFVIAAQRQIASSAIGCKRCGSFEPSGPFSAVIDDTNLNAKTRNRWKQFAASFAGVEHREIRMDTPLAECVSRDAGRTGLSHVGVAVIHRQFLESGRLPIDLSKPVVIVDVDGTLANCEGIRSPYDEANVHKDLPHENIVSMVNDLQNHGRTVIVVSGRHSTCGDATYRWLNLNQVQFDFLFMRHAWDNRSDVIVKQEILDAILKLVPKEQIDIVIDDRPKVIRMWRENGLNVFAARGEDLAEF